MINVVIIIFIILMFFTIFKSLFRLKRSFNYLKKYVSYDNILDNSNKINVIIPAYNEIKNVKRSVEYFSNLNDLCNVIYVTTSKEKKYGTFKELEKQIRLLKANNLMVINCPNVTGTMATQVNYAVSKLNNDDIIALYNIDSFPERRTFIYVLNNIHDDAVFQQVSFFDDNNSYILCSAQNWQNRWSLIYELGKYLSNNNLSFKYSIGHGIFAQKKLINKVGNWSDKEINEDNEFGYKLLINNIKILPIPFLEKADFANKLSIYIKQQSTWVNGPLYAFSYYKNNIKSVKNLLLTFLNFKAFISWWLLPAIFCTMLILSFMYNKLFFIIICLLEIIYISIINFLCSCILKKLNYLKKINLIDIFSDMLFFIIHSFGCYITLFKLFIGMNNIKNKYNTEK